MLGEADSFGPAGIITHIMNVQEIAEAMITMARNPAMRKRMGQAGYQRMMARYKVEDMKAIYQSIYAQCAARQGLTWDNQGQQAVSCAVLPQDK